MLKKLALVAIAASLTPACATITRGTKEAFVITSEPAGAAVTMTGKSFPAPSTCTTPCSVKVKRKHGFDVKVEKEGYETVETKVNTQVAGGGAAGMAGNVLVGGLIGAVVDGTNGAMNELKPNPLNVKLQQKAQPAPAPAAEAAADKPIS